MLIRRSVTSQVMFYAALGLPFFGASRILVSAFYALQDTKTPVKIATVCLVVNMVLNAVLMFPMKIGGIALASSIAGRRQLLLVMEGLNKKMWRYLGPNRELNAVWTSRQKLRDYRRAAGFICIRMPRGLLFMSARRSISASAWNRIFVTNTGSLKTDFLVSKIAQIDTIQTASEAEALILEASLIKQYQPKYNVELKDGKTYPFIQITKEEFPLVSVIRFNTRKS